ncbi:MAG TPA: hypothetical protein VKA49_21870 [Flavitalea sp.]|nr:hypothetical protein [Flavitalea sp.]
MSKLDTHSAFKGMPRSLTTPLFWDAGVKNQPLDGRIAGCMNKQGRAGSG